MEELFELRTCLEQRRYTDAMALLGEMEEMSKDDKINKISSFTVVLLLHLIKKRATHLSRDTSCSKPGLGTRGVRLRWVA